MSRRDADLNISVTFRHTDPTPALKNYSVDKLSHCLKKYVNSSAEVKIVLSVEKRDHIAEAKVMSSGLDISGKAVTTDLYSAIDQVVDHIDVQCRRQKDRQTRQKGQGANH